jgi:Flavin containing amine oxidoreductase
VRGTSYASGGGRAEPADCAARGPAVIDRPGGTDMRPRGKTRPHVVIAGAGIAGMTAALHLLEAGCDATVLESSGHVGGKFGATVGPYGEPHEHAYHFLGDWCVNLWSVMERIGLRRDDDCVESKGVRFLRPKHRRRSLGGRMTRLSLEALGTRFTENVHGGVIPPSDMIVWFQSLVELMLHVRDLDEREFLNRISVNGFMRSLPYMTDLAALLHQEALMKAFAIPSYETSARSYRRFALFFSRDRGGWILNRPVNERFWPRFLRALQELRRREYGGVHWPVRLRTALEEIRIEDGGEERARVSALCVRRPDGRGESWTLGRDFSDLLVAIPAGDLIAVVERSPGLRQKAPGLLELKKLKAKQMASLDVYFKRPLPGIPPEHVTLIDDAPFRATGRDGRPRRTVGNDPRRTLLASHGNRMASRFALSFVDNFQVWQQGARAREETWLNVVASDFEEVAGLDGGEAQDLILDELGRYLAFNKQRDVDELRTALSGNADRPLFMNTVGSWQHRPPAGAYRDGYTGVAIENLYLAGDYCRSPVDVVSLEGAVMTARIAARAVARRHGREGRVPLEAVPAEIGEWTLAQLERDLEPWLELATRGAFGAGGRLRGVG